MIESYLILAERIRKELHDLEQLVARADRAVTTARKTHRMQICCLIQQL